MKPATKTTNGIKVSAEWFYQEDYSNPLDFQFMFGYRVKIKNNNLFPVQLMERGWLICDSLKEPRAIAGWGVVGTQPVIPAGEEYEYVSGTNLNSEIGTQIGEYIMLNLDNKTNFTIEVPKMTLVAPCKNN